MTDAAFPVDEVLEFWFGASADDANTLHTQSRQWFNGGAEIDAEIERRFGDLPKPVAAMPAEEFNEPRKLLAAVLVLDQFPRHIFRGEASAFAFDDKALQLLDRALSQGWNRQLHTLHVSFLLMPLQHAEDLKRQQQGVQLFGALLERAPPPYREFIATNLDYAQQHLEIVQRFGRFPHRNRALGRSSTAEEQAYLAQGARSFGQ